MTSNEYNIEWKRSATKELRQLPREVVARILRVVEGLRTNPFPAGVRKLSGAEHTYRIREGSYRVSTASTPRGWSSKCFGLAIAKTFTNVNVERLMNTDISEILKKKSARRRALARLPFEEKVEIVRRLQELSREIKECRDENVVLRRAREAAADS